MKNFQNIVSIITPSYNQGVFIEETIQSVLMQRGDFWIDYVIMDGGSNDETVEVIKKYEHLLKENCEEKKIDGNSFYISKNKNFKWNKCLGISYRWVSEKDSGQAHAINKGIDKSFGEIIGWLNSDDVYYEDVLSVVAKQDFRKYDFLYGNGMWISKIGKNLLPYPTFEPSFYSFFYQCTLCQPAVFFSRKAFKEIGQLSNEYYCGFDFEYWMRALSKGKRFLHIDQYFAKSRMYIENKSLANQNIVNDDIGSFKNKYYKNLKLDENKLKKFKYIYDETFNQVQKMKRKLELGEKINILFDATVILNDLRKDGGRSGIFFVALNILKTMLNNEIVNLSLFCDKSKVCDLEKILENRFEGRKINIITEEDLGNIEDIDIYLSPVFKVPQEIKENQNIIKYTIIYDTILLMFPEYFPVKQDWLLEMIDDINKDDFYFAISENTKNDFIKYVPKINSKNIKVTHLAASESFYCEKDKEKRKNILKKYNLPIDKKYIFSLCTLEPRKNLIMSVRGFIEFIDKNKIDDLIFLLGGSHWDEFIEKLEKEIDIFDKYRDRIVRVGYIDDEDLSIFYSFSEFFVYPSLYEGFGLPVLEAMKCGIPVITSNNSSLPEVIGRAGITIDPKSEKEMLDAFEKLYFSNELRSELSKRGLERAKLFSWEKTVDVMVCDMLNKLKSNTFNKSEKINKGYNFKKYFSRSKIFLKNMLIKINFIILSPRKFIFKYKYKFLNCCLRQPIRRIWYAARFKKIK